MDNCEFKFWESACSLYSGCALYVDGELLASCVLENMTSKDFEQLHCFDLVSIYLKNLVIQKKIIKYNYREKHYFVRLLKEMKKKNTIFGSVSVNDPDQELFHSAGYHGRRSSMSYDPRANMLYLSQIE